MGRRVRDLALFDLAISSKLRGCDLVSPRVSDSLKKGKFTSIEYRRIQPIGGGVALTAGVNRIWYEADSAKFHGTGIRLGLTFQP